MYPKYPEDSESVAPVRGYSEDYQDVLERHGIICSISRRGNCLDNAVMESWNSTFKVELGEHFEGPSDAKACRHEFSTAALRL
jgi:transposase InsO family protein